jgi:hypothetical protein
MPTQVIKTTKREPLYEDADGLLYQQLTHAEGMRDLSAIREIVNAKSGEQETTVRWLRPIGTIAGSAAEQERLKSLADKAKTDEVQRAATEEVQRTRKARRSRRSRFSSNGRAAAARLQPPCPALAFTRATVNHFTIGDALVFLGCLAFFILLLLGGRD